MMEQEKDKFVIGAFGVIFDEKGQVLLGHRTDYDLWNLPGGGVEHGETPWEGMIREVKEETGLDVKVKRFSGVYSKPDKDEVVFVFVCEVVGGEIVPTDEADESKYFDIDEMPEDKMSVKFVERIRDAAAGRAETVRKVQTGRSVKLVRRKK